MQNSPSVIHTNVQYGREDNSERSNLIQPESKVAGTDLQQSKLTFVLIVAVTAAVIGSSAQFGYNTGVINNPENAIRSSLSGNKSSNSLFVTSHSTYSNAEWAATASIFAVGGMLGALPAGALADFIGRKWTMLLNNIIAIVGIGLESFAVHPYMLISGRFVIGINSGINTVLAPLYISEVSPVKYRGTMGVSHQLVITGTILFSQVLGIKQIIGRPDNEDYGWRILLAVPILFVVIQLVLLPWCPETPKYLYIKKRREKAAERALKKFCGPVGYKEELKAMETEYEESGRSTKSVVITDFFVKPSLRRPLIISIALHMSQQLTGIGSILLYSTDIFSDAGITNGDIATTVVGVVLVIGTIFTIVFIERFGRRTLMLYGLGGMTIFFALVSSAFCFQYGFYTDSNNGATAPGILLVIFTFGVTFSFALGPGAIPWLMVAELFQQEARPFAVSIATIVNWLTNFAIGFAFPFMLQHLKPYPFIIFAVTSAAFWVFMFLYLPETKGKTVDEITQYFKKVTKTNWNQNKKLNGIDTCSSPTTAM